MITSGWIFHGQFFELPSMDVSNQTWEDLTCTKIVWKETFMKHLIHWHRATCECFRNNSRMSVMKNWRQTFEFEPSGGLGDVSLNSLSGAQATGYTQARGQRLTIGGDESSAGCCPHLHAIHCTLCLIVPLIIASHWQHLALSSPFVHARTGAQGFNPPWCRVNSPTGWAACSDWSAQRYAVRSWEKTEHLWRVDTALIQLRSALGPRAVLSSNKTSDWSVPIQKLQKCERSIHSQ